MRAPPTNNILQRQTNLHLKYPEITKLITIIMQYWYAGSAAITKLEDYLLLVSEQ